MIVLLMNYRLNTFRFIGIGINILILIKYFIKFITKLVVKSRYIRNYNNFCFTLLKYSKFYILHYNNMDYKSIGFCPVLKPSPKEFGNI